jgi:tryptophan-rich sensory protein|uniref:Tryptophan-rich sensory protein n=1 Tax=viral metagenome TaxID=1070528 RepID=A0A6C0HUF7_9ZZZZ
MNQTYSYLTAFFIVIVVMLIPSGTMESVKSPWYKCIRPSITPPNYVFPIVWTLLYILIAIALANTLMLPNSSNKQILLFLYGFNLICNVLWSFAYFGNKDVLLAFFILLSIIITTGFILQYTYRLLPFWVMCILLPYQIWICFAGILNFLSLFKKCKKID